MDCEMDRNLNLHDDTRYLDVSYVYRPDCRCSRCVKTREEVEQDLAIDDDWIDLGDMRIWSATEPEPDNSSDWRGVMTL